MNQTFVTYFKSREEAIWWLNKNESAKLHYFGPTPDGETTNEDHWFKVEWVINTLASE